jgi:hypothetical protein
MVIYIKGFGLTIKKKVEELFKWIQEMFMKAIGN